MSAPMPAASAGALPTTDLLGSHSRTGRRKLADRARPDRSDTPGARR